jgi:hypothetical protein
MERAPAGAPRPRAHSSSLTFLRPARSPDSSVDDAGSSPRPSTNRRQLPDIWKLPGGRECSPGRASRLWPSAPTYHIANISNAILVIDNDDVTAMKRQLPKMALWGIPSIPVLPPSDPYSASLQRADTPSLCPQAESRGPAFPGVNRLAGPAHEGLAGRRAAPARTRQLTR